MGDFVLRESLTPNQLSGGVLQSHQGRALHQDRAVLPGGARVVLADAHAREDRLAPARVRLRDVVERDLAVVAHQDVRDAQHGDDLLAPERPVHGIRDVDVHLDAVGEPVVAVAAPPLLQEPGARDRLAQLRLRLADPALLLLRVGSARQIDPMLEGILEEAHPDPAGVRLVEVLVEEDHVDGQLAGAVVRTNAFGQGLQVAEVDLVEAQPVAATRAVRCRGSRGSRAHGSPRRPGCGAAAPIGTSR